MRDRSAYFGIVCILSLPFWLHGWAFDITVLPRLNLAALAVICPALPEGFQSGRRGKLRPLLRRVFHLPGVGGWIALSNLINPALFSIAHGMPALIELERPAAWIGWWMLWTLTTLFVMVWLFARGGQGFVPVAI